LTPLKEGPLTHFARGDVWVHILVFPQFLAFKLLKKSEGNFACEPRGFIGAEAPASGNTPIGLPGE
jgi:hypothetical protein